MQVLRIDHVNISGPPALIAKCRTFYVDVLALTDGYRPPFRSQGYWLYAGERPIVHLLERGDDAQPRPTGALNHVAFKCEGLAEMMARLAKHEVEFKLDEVPASNETQLFVTDPAGVALELNFSELVAERLG
jgi:catechol 2,3-dioxygenase-like lactoylglutathione lyase family enzyme